MRFRHRFPRMLLLLIALSGCMSWHTSTVDPVTLIDRDHPGVVRVTRPDRSRIVVQKPVVDGDSLRGRQGRHPVALPLSDLSSVSVHKTNVAGTVLLSLLTAATVAAAIAVGTWDGPLGGMGGY